MIRIDEDELWIEDGEVSIRVTLTEDDMDALRDALAPQDDTGYGYGTGWGSGDGSGDGSGWGSGSGYGSGSSYGEGEG